MGGSLSNRFLSFFYRNKEVRVLMCGLDAAGKTTILYKLKLGEIVTTIPTIGFNVETVEHNGINFITWDVSGRSGIRALWKHYTKNCDAVVFVVDSADHDRITECHNEIHRLCCDEDLKDSLLLVFANKQDLSSAMTINEVKSHLKLESLDIPWPFYGCVARIQKSLSSIDVQGCVATTNEGLYEGLDWLQAQFASKDVKNAVSKPIKESVVSPLSRIQNALKNYFWPPATEVS